MNLFLGNVKSTKYTQLDIINVGNIMGMNMNIHVCTYNKNDGILIH